MAWWAAGRCLSRIRFEGFSVQTKKVDAPSRCPGALDSYSAFILRGSRAEIHDYQKSIFSYRKGNRVRSAKTNIQPITPPPSRFLAIFLATVTQLARGQIHSPTPGDLPPSPPPHTRTVPFPPYAKAALDARSRRCSRPCAQSAMLQPQTESVSRCYESVSQWRPLHAQLPQARRLRVASLTIALGLGFVFRISLGGFRIAFVASYGGGGRMRSRFRMPVFGAF